MKNLSVTISLFFLLINLSSAKSLGDSTKAIIYIKNSEYISKLELTNTLFIPSNNVPVSIKDHNKKTARILRIAALPFFAAALIANNSRDWSRGFLIAGAGIELTSVYLELHKRKK